MGFSTPACTGSSCDKVTITELSGDASGYKIERLNADGTTYDNDERAKI